MLVVKIPYYMQLASIKDLARLASALEVVPSPVYAFTLTNRDVLAVGLNVGLSRPVFCYVDAEPSGEFIAYRVYMGNEEINMVNTASNPVYSYAPIIRVKEMPGKILRGRKEMNVETIVVSDLSSIAKLVFYRYMKEEVLTPLFLMRGYGTGRRDKGRAESSSEPPVILGMFISSNEDGTPYFCYTVLDSVPEGNFVRYSGQSGEGPGFTNDIDGHGYVYMKVIRTRDGYC